jgi:hypothetical protein
MWTSSNLREAPQMKEVSARLILSHALVPGSSQSADQPLIGKFVVAGSITPQVEHPAFKPS